jgi:hypothetical protein
MPAWIVRSGVRTPLIVGIELKPGDQLITGAGSRLVIKLAEGSRVRLGANGELRLVDISAAHEVFKGALNVLEGPFRFTSDLAARKRKRDVSIRSLQLTTVIRGTADVWGRARLGNEIVCVMEGAVQVRAEGEAPERLDQPLQCYRRIDGMTQPVGTIEQTEHQQWAAETELQSGRGVTRDGARLSLELARFANRADAVQLREAVRRAGFAAVMIPIRGEDETTYVVRIGQLDSRDDASALAEQLRGKFGISEPKVAR